MLRLVVKGYVNKEIARICGIRIQTVKNHLTRAYRKLGLPRRAQNRVHAVREAVRQGLVNLVD